MFTHSDAVSSKCRPVRLWNGSSSASLRRQATTRCWKAYRQARSHLPRLAVALAAQVFFFPAILAAQNAQPLVPGNPEVVNLTLKGVDAVKQTDLLQNIYTTASHCNSFILKPFCWISKSKYFFTKRYLDHKELERDVLRIRVFYWKRGYREAEVDTAVVPRGKDKVGVTFTITEGPPTLVSNIAVEQPTELLTPREISKRVVLGK